jgi:predicted AAA+ superfamily ATPase
VAVSNRDRVGRAFELLAAGLGPFVDRRVRGRSPHGDRWLQEWQERERGEVSLMDPSFQLKVMADAWDSVFRDELTRSDRNLVFELRDVRNKWAHNASFGMDDAYRALDSIERLLVSIDATEASEVGRAKDELMRLRYEAEARKATPTPDVLHTAPSAGLKPWREIIVPHDDVARGRFALAEFAADLHQVYVGEGSAEYVNPVEFFHRTYLTEGLRTLLAEAVQRMTTDGGVPVVDLQTNFGGGKTHSQIALWHLFSGTPVHELPQDVQDLIGALGATSLPRVRRVVLVGTKIAPGQPSAKPDGTVVRTLWGELAWQLGGAQGFALLAASDRTSTNPGDNLRLLFQRYAPCIVLIDEWVAYARQLGGDELPGGTFDTQFSFAQAVTEAARAVPKVLLVVSLPASEALGSGGDVGSDIELGGAGGREALRRLRSVIGRMESSWRPATAEESFEIVRRRLFKPIEPAALPGRDATARVFGELYRREGNEFPVECREAAYVDRIKAAYPLHPELFARLYEDWSTLDRFQRTRGVLRLMAAVIHALWEGGDQSPLILPASIPLSEPAVSAELTRNLDDSWKPIIDSDIDGPNALPMTLDRELPGTLGRFQAARRVARTVFLGSAPTLRSANRGIDAARIRLGCVLPGDTIATFGDALNRLSSRATYLYADAGRYWYGIQPSVSQVARSRGERLLNEARVDIHAEIVRRLREDARTIGDVRGVHAAPTTSADVSDVAETRLVVLPPDRVHIARSTDSPALAVASEMLERRGTAPREYRNMLVFLAPDNRRLDELERGVAEFLAWESIDAEAGADGLNLDPNQARQAATKKTDSDRMVTLRLAESYQWLLIPNQPDPTGPLSWSVVKADGPMPLAARVSRKLVSEANLYVGFPPTLLRQRLDEELQPLWGDGHVAVGALWDAFARYVYLPRLRDVDVLLGSIASGPVSTTWQQEGFATADAFDDKSGRYRGLVAGGYSAFVTVTTLVVQPTLALAQMEVEPATQPPEPAATDAGERGRRSGEAGDGEPSLFTPSLPRRFYGVVSIDPERLNRDFGRVAQEVVQHFTALVDTKVEVTVEVRAEATTGFPDQVVRTVTENAGTLKFTSHEFEKE